MFSQVFKDTPESVSGYEQLAYEIKLVKPLAATNLVANPSAETNTTGYTAVGGSIARIATEQRRGTYCVAVTPTSAVGDGVLYDTVSLVSGTAYYFSADVKAGAGVPLTIYVKTTAGVTLSSRDYVGTGRWERIWVRYEETSTTTRRLQIGKQNVSTALFYVDGLQVEADRMTTYLDGSMLGFVKGQVSYYWLGAPHSSVSTRILSTRSGGQEYNLADFGFTVTSLIGLGWSEFENVAQDNAFRGGASYQSSVQKAKKFDIVGFFSADSLPELMRKKSDLRAILNYSAGIVHQPLQLKIRAKNADGVYISESLVIPCLFDDGLGGVRDNYFQERVSLSFQVFKPHLGELDGDVGAELDFTETFTAAYHAARISGEWGPLGTGFNNTVEAIEVDYQRRRIYFAGNFTTANGVTVNRICYWNGTTFVAMDGGVNSTVYAIVIAPNGDVWIGGSFTTVGTGAAATKGLARWNIATDTWTAFNESTATFSNITALAISSTGVVYIGGIFTDWETDAGSDNIAFTSDNGVNWSSLGTGMNGSVLSIKIAADSKVYVAGAFTTGNGVTLNRIGYWNGTTFVAMSGGADNTIAVIEISPSGDVYIGGQQSTPYAWLAKWNGVAWSALGTGVNSTVTGLHFSVSGLLYVTGIFTSAGGLTIVDRIAAWNGTTWVHADIILPGGTTKVVIKGYDNDLYMGSDISGTAIGAGFTVVNNPGSADVHIVIEITGPGVLGTLFNETTGERIYFDLTLNVGETAVLNLVPGTINFGSNFRPNLLGTILPESKLATWHLIPGNNNVSLFILDDDANTKVITQFRPVYSSLDDILYR